MIEKPKPLNLPGLDPKKTLKAMLENSDRKDRGESYHSPLDVIDPMTLDELIARIDTGSLALNQVPDPGDIEKLVSTYWSMRDQFLVEQQMGIISRPKKNRSQVVVTLTKTVAEMLREAEEKEELNGDEE